MVIKNKDGTVYKINEPNPLMKNQDFWEKKDYVLHNCSWSPITFKDNKQKYVAPVIVKQSFIQEEPIEETVEEVVEEIWEKCWCLPAIITEYHDELYDEIRKSIKYLNKLKINLQVLDLGNITIRMITDYKIGIGSIIYRDTTWYKVKEIFSNEDLFVIDCMISEETPDFG